MEQPETQDAKAEVREATMRILKLQVNNPKTRWVNDYPDTDAEIAAAAMLKQAGYLDDRGRITLRAQITTAKKRPTRS